VWRALLASRGVEQQSSNYPNSGKGKSLVINAEAAANVKTTKPAKAT
jgi:hypothetical protein